MKHGIQDLTMLYTGVWIGIVQVTTFVFTRCWKNTMAKYQYRQRYNISYLHLIVAIFKLLSMIFLINGYIFHMVINNQVAKKLMLIVDHILELIFRRNLEEKNHDLVILSIIINI
jgi:hypothetical protein